MQSQDAAAPSPAPSSPAGPAVDVEQAEAALVEHYARLVRLAYLVLPGRMGRTRRVLTAHALVQRALPRGRADAPLIPAQSAGRDGDPGYALVRLQVVRSALEAGLPLRRLGLPKRSQLPPLLPQVWGLQVFPRPGGADELALDQRLAALSGPARAAHALRGLERLPDTDVRRMLAGAGVEDPDAALTEADSVPDPYRLLESPSSTPVRSRPGRPTCCAAAGTSRRGWSGRRRSRCAGRCCRCPVTAGAPTARPLPVRAQPGRAGRAGPRAADPDARLGVGDVGAHRLLGVAGARHAHRRPGAAAPRARRVGTAGRGRHGIGHTGHAHRRARRAAPPAVRGHGGRRARGDPVRRLASRPVRRAGAGRRGAALDLARVDGAGRAGASAVVLSRSDGNVRFLVAPWVREAARRDLRDRARARRPSPWRTG